MTYGPMRRGSRVKTGDLDLLLGEYFQKAGLLGGTKLPADAFSFSNFPSANARSVLQQALTGLPAIAGLRVVNGNTVSFPVRSRVSPRE